MTRNSNLRPDQADTGTAQGGPLPAPCQRTATRACTANEQPHPAAQRLTGVSTRAPGNDQLGQALDRSTLIATDIHGCDIHLFDAMAAVAELWLRFEQSALMTPFQRYEWLRDFAGTTSSSARTSLHIVVVVEQERVRMIAPLAIEKTLLFSRLIWLGHAVNDYNVPLVDGDWLDRLGAREARELWRHITHRSHAADYVHLIRQPARFSDRDNPFMGQDTPSNSSDAFSLTLSRNWAERYAELRSAKSRRRLREKTRKLGKSGPVRLRQIRNRDEIAAAIATILSWKHDQLERSGARNPFADGRFGTFLTHHAQNLTQPAAMRVYMLEVGAQPVAGVIALVDGHSFNFFVPAFDDTVHRNCSPGTIMLVKLMELAARAGLTTFDFSLGEEPYKLDWCDSRLGVFNQIEALSPVGAISAALARQGTTLKRLVKTNDALFKLVKSANAYRKDLLRGLRLQTGS